MFPTESKHSNVLLCFAMFCYDFIMFYYVFAMFLLCFAMFCYVFAMFYYVLLCFAMFLLGASKMFGPVNPTG